MRVSRHTTTTTTTTVCEAAGGCVEVCEGRHDFVVYGSARRESTLNGACVDVSYHGFADNPQRSADGATRSDYGFGLNLPARHRRLQTMLEPLTKCCALAEHPARQGDLQRRSLVTEQLTSQCADVKDELFHGKRYDGIGAQIA